MTKTVKWVTRDAVDPEALALLRSDPDTYIRITHRKLPSGFTRARASKHGQKL